MSTFRGEHHCTYIDILKISIVTTIVSSVPYAGIFASWLVLFYLLYKYTEAEIIEIIGMVIISQLLAIALLFAASFTLPMILMETF